MKATWPRVKLGEVLRYRKEFITINDLATYKRPRVQLHTQGIVLRDEIPGALIKTKKQQVCHSGEFLVAEIDAKVGGFGILPKSLEGAIVSSHYFLYSLDDSKLDRNFLDYFTRTPAFFDQIAAQGSTNYAAIRPVDVLSYEIPLAPLDEQRRIVARIEELAAQINEAQLLRQQTVKEIEFLISKTSSNLFDSLKCDKKALIGVAYKKTGTAYRAEDFIDFGDVPVVRLKEINTNKPTVYLRNPDVYQNVWVESGDIILAKTSFSTGAMCLWPGPRAVLNQNAVMLRAKQGVDQHYLFAWLKQQLFRYLRGHLADPNFYPYIREADLMQWPVPVPPLFKQLQIVAELDALSAELDRLKHFQTEANIAFNALLPSILENAFKGGL